MKYLKTFKTEEEYNEAIPSLALPNVSIVAGKHKYLNRIFKVGEILYSDMSVSDKIIAGLTPIAICVVPNTNTPDGKARWMSLVNMSSLTPEIGTMATNADENPSCANIIFGERGQLYNKEMSGYPSLDIEQLLAGTAVITEVTASQYDKDIKAELDEDQLRWEEEEAARIAAEEAARLKAEEESARLKAEAEARVQAGEDATVSENVYTHTEPEPEPEPEPVPVVITERGVIFIPTDMWKTEGYLQEYTKKKGEGWINYVKDERYAIYYNNKDEKYRSMPTLNNTSDCVDFEAKVGIGTDLDGNGNSEELLASETSEIALQAVDICKKFHTDGTRKGDWYLPGIAELVYLGVNISKINAVLDKLENAVKLGDFSSFENLGFKLLSSSEYNENYSWVLDTKYGNSHLSEKGLSNEEIRVRAFLAF